MGKDQLLQQIGYGAAAGLAGTAAMQVVRTANQKLAPKTTPPMRQDPGEYMLDQARELLPGGVQDAVSGDAKKTASALLSFGYGSTAAALYSVVRDQPNILLDGAALGLAIWSIGYLGWLPALKLMPDVRHQTGAQIATSIAQHLLYGVATVGFYRRLKRAMA